MTQEGTTAAAVVTCNRVDQLKRCIELIRAQTHPVDEIVVVDNASSDGTREFLAGLGDGVSVVSLEENLGGAAGFSRAIEEAWSRQHDWIWLLDDDAAPMEGALAALLEAELPSNGRPPMILASRVLWTNDDLHPMNRPQPRVGPPSALNEMRSGVVELRSTSFVSCLLNRAAVDSYGLPHAEYFVWNDDLEFTARVLRHEPGYWVPASVVYHETAAAHLPVAADPARFYYDVRNRLWMLHGDTWSPREKARFLRNLAVNCFRYLRRHRMGREARNAVARGLRDGLRRPPEIVQPRRR
jgi:rhamnopyranosyl-N-acetylglucosaminyl-diphospho-decaprenol beta-1,3/1,4-galactofuranosyltransferase